MKRFVFIILTVLLISSALAEKPVFNSNELLIKVNTQLNEGKTTGNPHIDKVLKDLKVKEIKKIALMRQSKY